MGWVVPGEEEMERSHTPEPRGESCCFHLAFALVELAMGWAIMEWCVSGVAASGWVIEQLLMGMPVVFLGGVLIWQGSTRVLALFRRAGHSK